MLNYQKTLLEVVEELGFTNDAITQEAYEELEQVFLDRWLTTLVALLPEKDQEVVVKQMEAGAEPDQFYEFLDASIDDIGTINQEILEEFVLEYKDFMGLE